jgi:hypothetical protein
VKFEAADVRGVFWRLPPDANARLRIVDKLFASQANSAESDALLLDSDDVLVGKLSKVGDVVAFEASIGLVNLPIDRVRGIVLARKSPTSQKTGSRETAKLQVGLRDGSVLVGDDLRKGGEGHVLHTDALGELRIRDVNDIASLQSFGDHVAYLSDLKDASYRHEPYLDLSWPYRRDRNVLNGPLIVGGRQFAKGLGLHSKSRLTFSLDGQYVRFTASGAIDDAAEGQGSVVFRVLLHAGGRWREVYESPTVCGGDAPQRIGVELGQADQLGLAVDYADRGDERDYADWLDARLERTHASQTP